MCFVKASIPVIMRLHRNLSFVFQKKEKMCILEIPKALE